MPPIPGIFGIPLLIISIICFPCGPCIIFIILPIWSNCFIKAFTSSIFLPAPLAIRFFLWVLIIDGLLRSSGEQGVDSLLKHGRFFLEGNAGIGGTTISDGGASANGLDLGFGPGYTYFITENIGLDASVKINGNLGFGNRGTTSDIGFRLGLNIFLPRGKAMSNVQSEMN